MRIRFGKLLLSLTVYSGRHGDYFVNYCPSLDICGYGDTAEEAEDSLISDFRFFYDDLRKMSPTERDGHLVSLGFKRDEWRLKVFSKMILNEGDILQEFQSEMME